MEHLIISLFNTNRDISVLSIQNEMGYSVDGHIALGVDVQGVGDKGIGIFTTEKYQLIWSECWALTTGNLHFSVQGERGQCMRDQLFHRPKSEREFIEGIDDRLPAARPNENYMG